MTKHYDALIIGGGHNGLTCAFYLARAGMRVRVLERRHVVGGAAVTEEFHPGFRNSTASYTVSLLRPKVIADMKLHDHGYRVIERTISNFFPFADNYLKLGGGPGRTEAEFARFSKKDAAAYPAYDAALEKVANVLRDLSLQVPPNVGGGLASLVSAARQGWPMAQLDLSTQRDLLDIFTKSARQFLDGWFEHDYVQSAFAFDAVVGNYAGVSTPGSAYVLLHHVFGEVNGKLGAWGHAVGGMGAITQAMARACESVGVEISLEAPVAKLLVDGRSFDATVQMRPGAPSRLAAFWAVTEDGHRSAVTAGENAGEKLAHDHVVRELHRVPPWTGTSIRLSFSPTAAADAAHAIERADRARRAIDGALTGSLSLREAAVAAALEVIDRDGLEALCVQAVARALIGKAAKAARNFAEADRLRQELADQGIVLKDSAQGTTWVKA